MFHQQDMKGNHMSEAVSFLKLYCEFRQKHLPAAPSQKTWSALTPS